MERGARFTELVAIMARLRAENGCPWDRQQTLATIKDYFLEEVYEAIEAIERDDATGLAEELGDVLFEVCFLARLAEEEGRFNVDDSLRLVCEKLVRRHPHVFGDEHVLSAEEVPGRWAALKAKEKAARLSILDGIPRSLPTLLQALRVSERTVAVGFEWASVEDVLLKLEEEIAELRAALADHEPPARVAEEVGDMLFTMVNVARKLGVSPHDALLMTLAKFRRRFGFIEARLREEGTALAAAGIERLEALWQAAKREERQA